MAGSDPWQAPDDDLFRPTVGETARDPSLPKPWRVGSQLYVAFFGGCFALFAIAWLNTHRLGMDWRAMGLRMAGWTLFAWALATAAVVGLEVGLEAGSEGRRAARWAYRGAAIGLHFWFAKLQEPGDRRYTSLVRGEDYASLWGPGFLAVVVGSVAQGIVTLVALVPLLLALGATEDE